MLNMTKTDWISYGAVVSEAFFIAFCFFSIVDSRFATQLSRLDIRAAERGLPMSIAPETLERAPESFRLHLKVSSQDFPTEAMTRTEAWSRLQNTVTAYARRLELMEGQNRKRSFWTSGLCLTFIVASLALVMLERRNRGNDSKEETETRKTEIDPA